MNEWGRQEPERGGADRRGFSWRGWYARKDWLESCTQTDDKLKRVRWEGENECGEVETERRRGKEGVRAARCPVIMTGLCGWAEEKHRVVFLFLLVMVTSGALSPDTGKKKRSGWFCQRKGGCPRIMIQLQGSFQCQKKRVTQSSCSIC